MFINVINWHQTSRIEFTKSLVCVQRIDQAVSEISDFPVRESIKLILALRGGKNLLILITKTTVHLELVIIEAIIHLD
jgi:hypothetical protein